MHDKPKYSSSFLIAETRSGIPCPVFWDPHTSIYKTGAPVSTMTGATGQGKTLAALLITANAAIAGKTVVALDYKGDFLKLLSIQEQLPSKINLWNVGDKSNNGALDPFGMSDDPGVQLELATELISLFVGRIEREERQAIIPIIKDIQEKGDPTLVKVVTALKGSDNERARIIGGELHNLRTLPHARLCFYTGLTKKRPPNPKQGSLTIASLAGMDLPETEEAARESSSGRLSSGILYLLTDYIRRVLDTQPLDGPPKLLVIDEAWAILATPSGQKVVKEAALLGRSKQLATFLVTQNPKHISVIDVENTIGTRFSFKASDDESMQVVRAMKLPENEGFEGLIAGLEPTICMMSDVDYNYGLIRFKVIDPKWLKAFSTNPYDLMQERRRERQAAEAKAQAARLNS